MVQVTMDGRPVEPPEGSTVLQAARVAGIDIPTLCDHPSLKPKYRFGVSYFQFIQIQGGR